MVVAETRDMQRGGRAGAERIADVWGLAPTATVLGPGISTSAGEPLAVARCTVVAVLLELGVPVRQRAVRAPSP